MALSNAERQRKYKEKAEATGLTRLQVWVTPTQQEAIRRMLAGEDRPTVRDNGQTSLLGEFTALKDRWEEKLKPHQDTNGQVKQPRWVKCWEMWQELAQVIHQNHQG
jgi:hypothetical protein